MIKNVIRRFWAVPGLSLRRFPLALFFSVLALCVAVTLHRAQDWGVPDTWIGTLVRLLLLWPFALFGNVGWTLFRERDDRPVIRGLLVGGVLLFGAYWLLPADPHHEVLGFWFRYALLSAALLVGTAGFPARRSGSPDLWDSALPVGRAAFMATLSAMLVVGGVSLALVSVEQLFDVNIAGEIYLDLFFAGFFVLAPVTAFAWLPPPFGAREAQPQWLKGTARIVLTPLCFLYALILTAYIGKIALSARWPDGWVAMPTLLFGALGLAAYFIARPARDREAERWAARFCRVFPLVLLPFAVILLLAMRVRIAEYGFTEWRVIGLALGLWLFLFAGTYSVRPRLSPLWLAATLGLLCVVLGIGPLSAPSLSLHSQRGRLDALLTDAGVRAGEPVTVAGDEARRIQSGLDYLLEHHGAAGLPAWVHERWLAWQAERSDPPAHPQRRSRRHHLHAPQVLQALNVTLTHEIAHAWYRVRCDMEAFPLAEYQNVTLGLTGHTNSLPFRVDCGIRVLVGNTEIATAEREAFAEVLMRAVAGHPSGAVHVPVEQMTRTITHAGVVYDIVFPELNINTRRQTGQPISHYGGNYLVFRRGSAPPVQLENE